MTNKLTLLLKTFVNLEEKKIAKIIKCFKLKSVKKNAILLHEGMICKEFYFVQKGCLRNYFINKEGHEKTNLVTLDESAGTSVASFISQKPSLEFIEALEDSELFIITYDDFHHLVHEIPNWKDFYLKFLEGVYLYQSRKVEALMTLNAKQRFQKLQKGNPVLIQRLSNKVLASFLDMREETLSRIKSK